MSGTEVMALAAAAGAAGVVNAVAGGGTLITFPALLFFGTPPLTANATSTVALVFGTAGSAYGFRRQILSVHMWLKRCLPLSLRGRLFHIRRIDRLAENPRDDRRRGGRIFSRCPLLATHPPTTRSPDHHRRRLPDLGRDVLQAVLVRKTHARN